MRGIKKGTKLPKWWVEKATHNRMLNFKHLSDETKKKISQSLLGHIPWNKGLTKDDIRVKKYIENGREKKRGKIPWNKGLEWSKEIKKKISDSKIGSVWTDEQKFKRSEMLKRNKFWGKDSNPSWKGGISREKYGFDFNEELRNLIRKRDNFKCVICFAPQEEFTRKLSIHHIDYNKKNNNPENLITLCSFCHGETNHNKEEWGDKIHSIVTEKKI